MSALGVDQVVFVGISRTGAGCWIVRFLDGSSASVQAKDEDAAMERAQELIAMGRRSIL